MPEPKKIMTLVIVHQHPKILLGMKKRGFGAGRWNGFGGKLEAGEGIEEAARREIREEVGIEVGDLERIGLLDFVAEGDPVVLEVHIFKARDFEGEPIESDEMEPRWFSVDEIPFKEMWKDDAYWMPLFLKDRRFRGRFVFDADKNIVEHEIVADRERAAA